MQVRLIALDLDGTTLCSDHLTRAEPDCDCAGRIAGGAGGDRHRADSRTDSPAAA